MYIEELLMQNFRRFAEASLTLNHPAREYSGSAPRLKNVNLLLGDNGSGKSSVFKALALASFAPIINSINLPPALLVRRMPGAYSEKDSNGVATLGAKIFLTVEEAQWKDLSGGVLMTDLKIERKGSLENFSPNPTTGDFLEAMYQADSPAFFLCGYAASRRTERPEGYNESSRIPQYQRFAGLFEDYVGLVPITHAALQIHKRSRFEEALPLLNYLLPSEIKLTVDCDSMDNPIFEAAGVQLLFSALSDGYRTFIGWVWDLLLQLARVAPPDIKLIDLPGVVIVDEIDLLLHPKWQREVVEKVANAFPHLQFFFSTHSPIVAGSLEPANIFVMDTGEDGSAIISQYAERIHGRSADQVLTSSYFELDSPRAPAMERALNGLAGKAETGDYKAAQEYLTLLKQGV